jgi:phthalate 4,5-cis-dihydrodiol dehydrogenase
MVGHSYGHGPQYRQLRQLLGEGTWGAVHHIQINAHTDFLARPRALDDAVESAGGEVVWNQFPHILDAARMLGANPVNSVDASLTTLGASPSRNGMCAVRLRCDGGTSASLFYSGYGRFDSNEFSGWIGEAGEFRPPRALAQPARGSDGAKLRSQMFSYGGPYWRKLAAKASSFKQNFGATLISCEHADIRLMPHGFRVYKDGAVEDVHIPVESPFPGHTAMLEAYVSMRTDPQPSTAPFSADWATETVALLEAVVRSARTGKPVDMQRA